MILHTNNRGLTLIEMLIYVAITALLMTTIVSALVHLTDSHRLLVLNRVIQDSGTVSLERITREIRAASSVDIGASVLNQNPGALELLSVSESGSTRRVRFTLQNGILYVTENGVLQGPLSPASASTTSLVFRRITTANSEAVKIEIVVSATSSRFSKTIPFYNTTVLRGSY